VLAHNKEKLINYNIINKSMLKYPISTLLYLAKLSIKDKIQDILKLHNNIDVKLTVTVKDKNGKIIKVHKQRSHSFTANFLGAIGEYFYLAYNGSYVANYTMTNISNNTFYIENMLFANAGQGDSSYGIVVGTGTATPTPKDYALGSQISNGTGSGQLEYGSHTFIPTSGSVIISGNTAYFQIIRTFVNQSGASITVTETGIIVKVNSSSGTTQTSLIVHDLLSSPITIPNGSVLQITYTISVTT